VPDGGCDVGECPAREVLSNGDEFGETH
jgi:hypothetical protein